MLVSVVESMQKRQEPKFKASDKLVGSRGAPWAPSAVDSGGVAVADGVAARALRSAGGVVPAAPSLAALAASEMSDVDDGLAATSLPPPLNARRACRLSDSLRIAVPSVRAVWAEHKPPEAALLGSGSSHCHCQGIHKRWGSATADQSYLPAQKLPA